MIVRSQRASAAVLLLACVASPWALAQDLTVPATGKTLSGALLPKASEAGKRLVGTWGIRRDDKETGETETTLIDFRADGSYATRLRSSVFKEQEKMPLASGRYTVVEDEGKTFTLVLDRAPGDPDGGKEDAPSRMRISVVDDNTLRAEDGSVVQRTR